MRYKNTLSAIVLNILFCGALLWFFSRNAYLRPFLGSMTKEFFSGVLLLAILYANYYVLYPKLHQNHIFLYWVAVAAASLAAGCVELATGYSYIAKCQAFRISEIGLFKFLSKHLFLVFTRNLAFNFFPFMLRERRQLQDALNKEVNFVYQYARMLDVCDKMNNCQHIPVDNILYCRKEGNYTYVFTVNGEKMTRYCSIKYMEQHLGDEGFIRISSSVIVPFQHIASCDGNTVVMKKMPWMEEPLAFGLDISRDPKMVATIKAHLGADQVPTEDGQPENEPEKDKKKPSVPPKYKLDTVLNYIEAHPGCRSTEIQTETSFSLSTVERCIAELKQQGRIQHSGSKKSGGYEAVRMKNEEWRMKT